MCKVDHDFTDYLKNLPVYCPFLQSVKMFM
jgi:hypothetical protein